MAVPRLITRVHRGMRVRGSEAALLRAALVLAVEATGRLLVALLVAAEAAALLTTLLGVAADVAATLLLAASEVTAALLLTLLLVAVAALATALLLVVLVSEVVLLSHDRTPIVIPVKTGELHARVQNVMHRVTGSTSTQVARRFSHPHATPRRTESQVRTLIRGNQHESDTRPRSHQQPRPATLSAPCPVT